MIAPLFLLWVATDAVSPGRLVVDAPTLESLGFRWYLDGDDNRNASANVSYRKKGSALWQPALPMLRVHHEVVNRDHGAWRAGNLFAGSVMFLQPATSYEVRFEMRDPDGGAGPARIVTASTRAEPRAFSGRRRIPVRPGEDLQAAYGKAAPGDVILLHAGVHSVGQTLVLARSGAPGRPIVFRGAGGGEAILEGPGHQADLFDIRQADHLWFEDLTLRRARTAIRAGEKGGPGASHLVVRRCRLYDLIYGIRTTSENSENWFIADNEITGINPTWHPRPDVAYMSPAHTGVNVYGRGHVVAYNRISRFSDNVALANFGPPLEDAARQPVSVDIHHNELSFSQDDCLETDYGAHNVRIWRNRCFNSHTGLSVQPFYGGPVYLIANELYAVTALTFKIHNYAAGIEAYHNTAACSGAGWQSFNRWQNGHFRNNLFLGGETWKRPDGSAHVAYAMNTGTITSYSTLDYNGWRRNTRGDLIRWFDGALPRSFASLEEFAAATGHEKHGRMVDYDVFVKASPPALGRTYQPAEWDLRLNAGAAAVDAGLPLPNINDGFRGSAPDLGCYELGAEAPRYGPRR
jgi:hypothetical protein